MKQRDLFTSGGAAVELDDTKAKRDVPWVVYRDNGGLMVCTRCSQEQRVALPMSLMEYCDQARKFINSHRNCKEKHGNRED